MQGDPRRCFATRHVFLLLLTFLFILPPVAQGAPRPHRTLLLRIDAASPSTRDSVLALYGESKGEALLSSVRDTMYLLATPAEAQVLRERGFRFTEVLQDSVPTTLVRRALFGPASVLPPSYHTYDEVVTEVRELERRFPTLFRTDTIGTTSQERIPIHAVHVTGPGGTPFEKPAILFTGCHHADEVLGTEICMGLLQTIAQSYEKDPVWTDRVNRFRIVVVPVLNVEGHNVVTSGRDPRWRKNTRDLNGNGILAEEGDGVDINRNYDFNWAHGGSGDPSSERYRGQFPFSESENRAMRRLASAQRFLLSVTYHSQGEVIYYPWDWRGRKAPDDGLLTGIARRFAGAIRTMDGDSSYHAEYGAGTVGQSYPWLYGTFGTFDFVVETGLGAHIVPETDVAAIVESNILGLGPLFDAGTGPGITGRITDAKTGRPVEAAVRVPAIETEDIRHRTSHPRTGRFWRLLPPGRHDLLVTCDGYQPVMLRGVQVDPGGWIRRDIALTRLPGRTE